MRLFCVVYLGRSQAQIGPRFRGPGPNGVQLSGPRPKLGPILCMQTVTWGRVQGTLRHLVRIFSYFLIVYVFLIKFEICWYQNYIFWASPCKTMQNHLEISSKNQFLITYFLSDSFFSKIIFFNLQTKFFDGQILFFRFLAEIRLRTPLKSHQKASSRAQSYNFHPTCTLP